MKHFTITQRMILWTLILSLSIAIIMGLVSRQFSPLLDAEKHLNAADDVLSVGSQITDDLYKLYQAQEVFDQFLSEQTWHHYFELNNNVESLLTKMKKVRGFNKKDTIISTLNESRLEMQNLLQTATYTINPNFSIGALSTEMLKRIRQTRGAIQKQIKEVMLQQNQERTRNRKFLKQQLLRLHSAIFWIALLVLFGGALFAAYLHRTTLAPLRELMQAMKKVKTDQTPSSLVPVGAPEMRELIITFNRMTGQLSRHAKQQQALLSLAMNVAHEVRNPLAGIGNAIQVLEQSYPADGSDREIFQEILKEVYRINTVISDLLLFSRPKPLTWEMIPFRTFLEELRIFLRPTLTAREITLQINPDDHITSFPGDSAQLHRSFLNLLTNAIHAVSPGGTILIECSRHIDGRFLISVEDSGEGIPEAIRDQVFLPFFTTRNQGTGLGLAIVQDIIERHQGTIQATAGRTLTGARMEILLPAAIPPEARTQPTSTEDPHEKDSAG
jgi:signal transduction histidine kinase